MADAVSPQAQRLHDASLIVDLHAHPSFKTYLWRKRLADRHRPGGSLSPFSMRVDLPKMRDGGLNVLLSAIHLPERALLKDCGPIRLAKMFAPRRLKDLFDRNPFEQTMKMIDDFESQARLSYFSRDNVTTQLEFAMSGADVDDIMSRHHIAALHTIEGAHSLDGEIQNVRKFFDRGVALITLAHFYENGVAAPVHGVPPGMRKLGCFDEPVDLSKGLTPFGRDAVEEMLDLGILVDMTHCTKTARDEVVSMATAKSRPPVMTHVGVKALADREMNPDDAEIRTIADAGGLIGVIFMNYWITEHHHAKPGLMFVVETMKHLKQTGGIECIGVGSDFDGFTDPPDDLKDPSQLPHLTEALSQAGFTDDEIGQIWGLNFRRVLASGWGR